MAQLSVSMLLNHGFWEVYVYNTRGLGLILPKWGSQPKLIYNEDMKGHIISNMYELVLALRKCFIGWALFWPG